MKLLFLCTHNRCRSVLCEAITRDLADGQVDAASAGSHPAGNVHPQTLIHLERRGYSTANLNSKGFEAVADFEPDAVITVCDQAAQESCPVWLDSAVSVHWGLPDPTHVSYSTQEMDETFDVVMATIARRIQRLLAEMRMDMSSEQLTGLLTRIGEEDHGTV
ncbi:MAG: arsenate reductase ArsC [Pseudomonadota bacterium]